MTRANGYFAPREAEIEVRRPRRLTDTCTQWEVFKHALHLMRRVRDSHVHGLGLIESTRLARCTSMGTRSTREAEGTGRAVWRITYLEEAARDTYKAL